MTIIAVDRSAGIMLADTLISKDGGAYLGYAVKIFRGADGCIGGAAGGCGSAGSFNEWLIKGRKGKPNPEWFKGDDGCEGLILTPKKEILWYMGHVPERVVTNTHAIGFGASYFTAAMMGGADIRRAVNIACLLNGACGGEITEMKVARTRKP